MYSTLKCLHLNAVPEGVAISSIESPSSNSVLLTWKAPTNPNGIIVQYELWRSKCPDNVTWSDDSSASPGNNTSASMIRVFPSGNSSSTFVYLDDSRDILPFTCHRYQVVVRNQQFYGASTWVSITTRPASKTFVGENKIYLKLIYVFSGLNDIFVEICHFDVISKEIK